MQAAPEGPAHAGSRGAEGPCGQSSWPEFDELLELELEELLELELDELFELEFEELLELELDELFELELDDRLELEFELEFEEELDDLSLLPRFQVRRSSSASCMRPPAASGVRSVRSCCAVSGRLPS
ncbi:MAG: hypothetical protein AB7S71_03870 [Dongiaceae bacterium]